LGKLFQQPGFKPGYGCCYCSARDWCATTLHLVAVRKVCACGVLVVGVAAV